MTSDRSADRPTGAQAGPDGAVDFAHTEAADRRRREKATQIARYAWNRGIEGDELLAIPVDRRRRLAREAGANPPSGEETWRVVARLLDEMSRWAATHPDDPRAGRAHADEKIMWVKRPPPAWS